MHLEEGKIQSINNVNKKVCQKMNLVSGFMGLYYETVTQEELPSYQQVDNVPH